MAVESVKQVEFEFRRKVLTEGPSFYVSLPKVWVKAMNIKKADYMRIVLGNDGTLKIKPEALQ
jgi:antitoxin component of MazEF toxin-antitoxin module